MPTYVSRCHYCCNSDPASCLYCCSSSSAAKATATVVANREKALQQCKLSPVCPAAAPATAPAAAPATASSCCPSLLRDMLAERVATIASTPPHVTNNTITAPKATSNDQTTLSSQHHRDWQCPARAAHTKAVLNSARERGITTGQKDENTPAGSHLLMS